MEVQVQYYGQAEEIAEKVNETIQIEGNTSLNELKKSLENKYKELKTLPLKYAVNSSFEESNYVLKSGDLVAVMPPFAGG